MVRVAVALIVTLLLPASAWAQAEKRIALLIGNKDYRPSVGALINPLNDTRVIGEALKAIGFGVGWIFIVLGLLIRTPMTVMTIGFSFLFPLVFGSNIMVDPATMPSWLQALVDVNPVSLMATAVRGLMGNSATLSQIAAALIAPALLTLLLAPTTLWLYRRR